MHTVIRVVIIAIFVLLAIGCSFNLHGEIRPLDLQQTSEHQSHDDAN